MLRQSHAKGFTIVELLIVIVVIAILAAITLVSYNGITNNANRSALHSAISQASKKVMTYAVDNAEMYPAALSDVSISDANGIVYQYTVINSGTKSYCITGYKGSIVASIDSNGTISSSVCSGHTTIALSCPAGYIRVPANATYGTSDFCVMKYEAKDVSGVATSQATGTPWVSITHPASVTAANAACSGCHLITDAEWMTIAANIVSVPSNWVSGTIGTGTMYKGHGDNTPTSALAAAVDSDPYNGTGNNASSGATQRRTYTLTNGEVIWDFSGNVHEFTGTLTSGAHPGLTTDTSLTTKAWNDAAMVWNAFPVNSRPSSAYAGAGSWSNAVQGIGNLYSQQGSTATRIYLRGGSWSDGAGIFSLHIGEATTNPGLANIGFRATR